MNGAPTFETSEKNRDRRGEFITLPHPMAGKVISVKTCNVLPIHIHVGKLTWYEFLSQYVYPHCNVA